MNVTEENVYEIVIDDLEKCDEAENEFYEDCYELFLMKDGGIEDIPYQEPTVYFLKLIHWVLINMFSFKL